MKNLTIAGGIGKDAVTRTTQGGDKVTGFSVAVEERNGQDKRTLWFDCSLWGRRGEALAQYLTKGTRVTVSGDLSTHEHEGRTYLTVRANDVTLQGGGQRNDSGSAAGGAATGSAPGRADYEDSIPFAPQVL
ncbi:single-strand binding protein [Paracoccus alcaliphilus]|uniref:Single-stranded DNA-binding protein n=1 Tax=Paracoccus alcaliphilus TaxID=34002 RepID=A0A1H8H286_9RHOB|nr:single-stranded DNA-binding protein [Paracoccus alcaliphilus]WCR17410.1 single-stranded DNA-binding protein [Paracoccus alcaliphilus]SEN50356.1 single-strand binding protein [Paracoccus alcaliphilus]